MILLDDKYIVVKYDDTTNSIYYKWKGFTPTTILRSSLEQVIVWAEKYKATTLVSNLENIGAVSKTDQDWVANQFMSALMNIGLKHFAVILPTSIFGKLSNDEVVKKIPSQDVVIQNFDNEQKAFTWAKEMYNQSR